MKIDFAGKKAIVCGGSRGIGKAIALGFAACGGDVSICARDPKTLEETRAEIARHGHKAHAASADLSQGDAVRGYVREAVARTGRRRFPGQQCLGLRRVGRRQGLDQQPGDRHDVDRARHAGSAAGPEAKPGQRGQHLLDRRPPSRGAAAALRRDQGGGDPLHRHAGRALCQGPRPGELHRARLDRVSRRRLGPAQDRQSRRSTTPRWPRSRSAAWAMPRRSPTWRCSSPRPMPRG